jgi:hypothetical protein
VLKFLKLLLSISLLGVIESERVVTSLSLSNTEITGCVVTSLLLDNIDTSDLKIGHEKEDLENGKSGNLGESLEGVEVGVSINSSPIISGKSSEKSRSEESNDSHLSDTSVDEFGLAVPVEVTDFSLAAFASGEPGSYGYGGESQGIESDVSEHGSVEGSGSGGEGECDGGSSVCPSVSRGGCTRRLF